MPAILDAFRDPNSLVVSAMDALFDGVYVTDRDRRIVFWNKGAEHITGYAAADVQGRRCADDILNHIDENGALVCTGACPLLETFRTGATCEKRLYPLTKPGPRIPVVTHVAPLRDADGSIVGAIEVFRDFSKEEDFRMLQEKFNALVKRYVSTATLSEIQSQLDGPGGESTVRDLTVMYLDVVGFTSFSERHSSGEAVKLLNDVFGICEVLTRRFHGDIDKFIGDAVMATFIDANDAADAGRYILGALAALNESRRALGLSEVRVRIGMNSGMLIQGNIGTIDRKDLTVIGDVVNTAARIQTLAEPDSIFVSESTLSRLKNQTDFSFSGEMAAKGKASKIKVFALRAGGTAIAV
jgi:PAS domain S-box-containing protein